MRHVTKMLVGFLMGHTLITFSTLRRWARHRKLQVSAQRSDKSVAQVPEGARCSVSNGTAQVAVK